MHVHGIAANTNLGSLEAANAAQRSANIQQAANVRKDLAKTAAQLEADAGFEALLLADDVYQGQGQKQAQRQSHPRQADAGGGDEERSTGEEAGVEASQSERHWSYWA